jgi:hypothetical protein
MNLKKWSLLAITATLAICGCAGDGAGGGGGGGGGGGTLEPSVNTTLLSKPGLFQVTYNTGQGRGTTQSQAEIKIYEVEDQFGLVTTILNPARILALDFYTSQSINISIPMNPGFSTNLNSREFDEYRLEIRSATIAGNVYTGNGGSPLILQTFPMRVRMMPGRTTSMQVFLNDAIIFENGSGGVTFDIDEFIETNFSPDEDQIVGFVADYLQFDISGLALKPEMLNTTPADYVYLSGDAIALSVEPQTGGAPFEVLVPLTPDPGVLEGLVSSAPTFPPNAPGTYTLRPVDPRSLPGTSHITALQGTWRPWVDLANPSQSPILNPGSFVCMTLPQTLNDQVQDLVMIAMDAGGAIVRMYFGEVNLVNGSFAAWPIDQIDDGSASNEINGVMNAFVYRPGIGIPTPSDIRKGNFSITTGSVPAEFPATGKFIVYRL